MYFEVKQENNLLIDHGHMVSKILGGIEFSRKESRYLQYLQYTNWQIDWEQTCECSLYSLWPTKYSLKWFFGVPSTIIR